MSLVAKEARSLSRLALPIVLTNLGTMLMGVVDMLMVGRLDDPQALAAAALATVWIHGTTMFAMGVVFGIDPLVTQGHGARDGVRVGRALQWGSVVAIGSSVVVMVLWGWTEEFLVLARDLLPSGSGSSGLEDETIARAAGYARVQVWSATPFLLFIALRQYLQGREIVRPALLVMIVANVLNVAANRILIFGGLGIPALGLEGAGIATGLARVVMFLALFAIVARFGLWRGAWAPLGRGSFSLRGIGEVLRFGIPTGLQMGIEIWAFGAATLMAGKLGDTSASAHQIVLNMAAMSFMVPLGISFAAATRVGNLIGSGQREHAQTAAWVAFGMGAGAMSLAALFFLATRTWVPSFFFSDLTHPDVREVLILCGTILPIAATFQVFDGIQVVGCGILRGMGQTLPAAVINLLGYWVLALPIAAWMTFGVGLGLRGVWWGLALGLALVAVALLVFVRYRGPARATAILT